MLQGLLTLEELDKVALGDKLLGHLSWHVSTVTCRFPRIGGWLNEIFGLCKQSRSK